jgi:hypothetical protein
VLRLALEKPFSISDLKINGTDIMEITGLKPSREVGDILQKLFEEEIQIYFDTPTLDPRPSRLGLRKQPRLVAQRSFHNSRALLISRWAWLGLVGVLASLLLSYFIWSIIHLVSTPPLEVQQPDRDTQTDQAQLIIAGKSSPQAQVTINDQVVPLDTSGSFQSTVILHEGLNAINISATTKQSKPRMVTRYVLYHATK